MILHALRNPYSVGAVAPASSQLVTSIVSQVNGLNEVVVELGAGTGVITNALLDDKTNNQKIVTIEIDRHLAKIARDNLPDCVDVIIGDAIEIATFFGENAVDCIVCSLPLTLFSVEDLECLLSGVRAVLKDQGKFVFYLYRVGVWSHRYKMVTRRAEDHFSRVSQHKTIWRNLPPARVIVCS